MDELVRITKKGGYLDLKVPYETTTWDGIYHQKPFNVITFLSYINRPDYEIGKMPLKIVKIKFYTSRSNLIHFLVNPLFTINRFVVIKIANFLIKIKKWAVDYSFLKYLMHNVYLQCVYKKIK